MTATAITITPATVANFRARVEQGKGYWMGDVVPVAYETGELNAIPGAYLTDASYTEKPIILSGAMDEAECDELLSMTDAEIIEWAEAQIQA